MKNTSKKKLILPLIGLLVCIFIGLGSFFYINKKIKVALNDPITIKDIDIDAAAALKLNLLEQVSKKNGITEWKLKASSATLLKKEDKAILKDVDVIFYTKENDKVHLNAEEGILNTRTHDMTFLKNVVVRHETYTLKTEKLHYGKKAHIIHSDAQVRLEDHGSVITADSMETRLNQNLTILQGHVKGKFSEGFNIP